ncbi:MAG: copper resistance protein B [Sulfurovum sp.]|nr:copper resistance protein B [Sulfurovum sp.]MCB4752892.1 copper resistance protein B [Sulfurovum sp.]
MKKILKTLLLSIVMVTSAYAASADDPLRTMFLVDQLELRGNNAYSHTWDTTLYIGYDLDKLYLYSKGEATSKGLEHTQNDFVYSRAIMPFWDVQAGICYNKNTNTSNMWWEIAVAGLAPYWFETRAALLLNTNGNIGLRLDAEYEMLFTQKLILTPKIEMDFYSEDDSMLQIGSGLSSAEATLYLRYEFVREFAPYIGINWGKTFGNMRNNYEPVDKTVLIAGVRFWF